MDLKNNTLLIINDNYKDKVINDIRNNNYFLDIKFMSLNEFKNNYYFSYDEKTIYYLINKYNYDYDVCIMYLNNLYYVNGNDFNNDKIKKLINLKKELENNNLLYYNDIFRNSLVNKNIVIYNYCLNKFDNKLIDELKNICNVTLYNDNINKYKHNYIYEFNDIEGEVSFVAEKIINLINDGIDINDIKICGIGNEYKNTIKRLFSFYNIPINFNDNYLYSTSIGKDFLNNLSNDISSTFNYITDKYNMKDDYILCIYNDIINIINKYLWCDNILEVKELIIRDFKNKVVNVTNYEKEIEVINSLDGYYDKYIFLMNFSLGVIPKNYMNDDYLSDSLKLLLDIDTSSELNDLYYNKWLDDINSSCNLFISYKKHCNSIDYYISSLNDKLNLSILNYTNSYDYSNIYNKIILTRDIDNLIKYNTNSNELSLLYNNYSNINYMSYNNKFTYINSNKLKEYLNHKLVLSYSAINNYYHCSFKYYLSNVLKLNLFEDNFNTIIGSLFHYILSICFDDKIDIKKEYYNYIDKLEYKFNSRELFFLDNLYEEVMFVINTIKKQYEFSTLNKSLYEEKIEIDKSREDMLIIFKGFVDKILMDNDSKIASIIDYKTGNVNLDLNNISYGLDLQLPVYVYLTKYKFPNIRIVGFYLQRILNSEVVKDNNKSYLSLKEDKLKLQGYSNNDINILELFDSSYNSSNVIMGMRTGNNGIMSKKIFDDGDINKICDITDDKINYCIDEIINSRFDINPKRIGSDNVGCMYCKYKDICFVNDNNIVNLDSPEDIFS
ncbi:MAG: PD-(D/E)XK nuclease family protein [Bacilli bacterium]|nr:PD-(D/E)XK nuclease family protein [Bacilli bacterium]